MTPLYNHSSAETAYLVNDYPYGRTTRCRIRYWLESHPTRGFRFVSQTENPKTSRWNAPKPSTYMRFAGAMYLDDQNHVHWAGLSEYSDAPEALQFVERFPGADLTRIRDFAKQKAAFLAAMAAGKASITINGTIATTDADRARAGVEAEQWKRVAA